MELTMSNGTVAVLTIHDCYPDVPAGVLITSLSHTGLTKEKNLALREKINEEGIAVLPQMYNRLMSEFSRTKAN